MMDPSNEKRIIFSNWVVWILEILFMSINISKMMEAYCSQLISNKNHSWPLHISFPPSSNPLPFSCFLFHVFQIKPMLFNPNILRFKTLSTLFKLAPFFHPLFAVLPKVTILSLSLLPLHLKEVNFLLLFPASV